MNIQSTGNNALKSAEERLRLTVQSEQNRREAAGTKNTSAARSPQAVLRDAGRSFLSTHPEHDVAEGVVMSLSAQGREKSAQAARRDEDDGRVTKVADQTARTGDTQQTGKAQQDDASKKVPPPMKEAVDALHERNAEKRTEDKKNNEQIPAGGVQKETPKVKPPQQNNATDTVTGENGTHVNTANLGQYNKKELMDFFLSGDISLKEYKDEIDSRTAQARAAANPIQDAA